MRQLGKFEGTILFTDIKNFTLKTSLLTQKQIEDLLNRLNDLIFPIISKYNGEIVKSLGDSYMIIFTDSKKAVSTSIEIQNILLKYNQNIKFDLYKIELRLTLDYGTLDKKFTIKGNDYFGEAVNIAARLQGITNANKIYITEKLYKEIKNEKEIKTVFLGEVTFKGILHNIKVYDVIYNNQTIDDNIKKIDNFLITDDLSKLIKNIDDTIFKFASVASILGIQPVPFLDVYALLPLHLYLLKQIAKEYNITLSKEDSKEIITTVMGSVSGSYLLSQGIVGLSKVGLLGLGGYLMIPLNFALTYAIGKILSYYLYKKSRGIKSTNKELNTLFKYSISSGKNIAKKDKKKILNIGKKYKDDFLKILDIYTPNINFLKRKK